MTVKPIRPFSTPQQELLVPEKGPLGGLKLAAVSMGREAGRQAGPPQEHLAASVSASVSVTMLYACPQQQLLHAGRLILILSLHCCLR